MLKGIYFIWYGFLGLFFIELGLMALVVLCGLYGYQIADQMSIYRISQNIVASVIIDGVPFILVFFLTICVYNTRLYEVENRAQDFKSNMDPLPWKSGDTSKTDPKADDLDQIMLATNLLINSLMVDPSEKQALIAPVRRQLQVADETFETPRFSIKYI